MNCYRYSKNATKIPTGLHSVVCTINDTRNQSAILNKRTVALCMKSGLVHFYCCCKILRLVAVISEDIFSKIMVCFDMMSNLVHKHQHFIGICCNHLQDRACILAPTVQMIFSKNSFLHF